MELFGAEADVGLTGVKKCQTLFMISVKLWRGRWFWSPGFLGIGSGLDGVSRMMDGGVTVTVGSLDIVLRIRFSLCSIAVTAPARLDTRSSSIMERKESTDDGRV